MVILFRIRAYLQHLYIDLCWSRNLQTLFIWDRCHYYRHMTFKVPTMMTRWARKTDSLGKHYSNMHEKTGVLSNQYTILVQYWCLFGVLLYTAFTNPSKTRGLQCSVLVECIQVYAFLVRSDLFCIVTL